jgi:hypothetical protein
MMLARSVSPFSMHAVWMSGQNRATLDAGHPVVLAISAASRLNVVAVISLSLPSAADDRSEYGPDGEKCQRLPVRRR